MSLGSATMAGPSAVAATMLRVAAPGCWYALVAQDRQAAAAAVQRLLANAPVALHAAERGNAPPAFVLDARQPATIACVHRQPRLLPDHTLLENWMLCLFRPGRDSGPDLQRALEEAEALYGRHVTLPRQAYPASLPELTQVAAQLVQAHLLEPQALVLDALFSGWHVSQREVVTALVRAFALRFPFRPIVHVDVEAPPAAAFPSEILEVL